MIIEITRFMDRLDSEFKVLGLRPREGLHILLKNVDSNNSENKFVISNWELYRRSKGKNFNPSLFLKRCAKLSYLSWTANYEVKPYYQKCLDLPSKGIHTISPFCLGFKKTSLEGGKKFQKDKKKIFERLDSYFKNASLYVEDEKDLNIVKDFAGFIANDDLIMGLLRDLSFTELDEKEYIIFYLDLPEDKYESIFEKYLSDKLFNKKPEPIDVGGKIHGIGNFHYTLNANKPFLIHKTATFDVSGRISSSDLRNLQEFKNLMQRKILPTPLPIFLYQEELLKKTVNIFRKEALLEQNLRKSHAEIIGELYKDHRDDFGNYYLLYYTGGKIKDFDYVSKFRYEFQNEKGLPQAWQVHKLMRDGEAFTLENVFEFQNRLLPAILNNSLVVKSKKGGLITKYFEDIDQKYCDNNNAVIYGLVLKYRKALYDFIYKSKQASLTAAAFRDIMLSGIASDIRRDEERKNGWRICQKLNIWFSLNRHFDPSNSNFNRLDMTTTIPQLMAKMRLVANENAHFETPEEFAFGAGQVIYFLLDKSRTGNKTHALLEPFTQKVKLEMLKLEIARIFDRYKHEISFGKGRFERLMREVLGYSGTINLKSQIPVLLAGYFADPVIYEKKENDV